jgi:soluble lytic murein transglycosylase
MKWALVLLILALPQCSFGQRSTLAAEGCVQLYAMHYRVSPELIGALIDVESRWNPHAVSKKGALGLMQLMPETARRFGAHQPFDVEQNIAAGTRYVTTLMWEFHGDLRLVAAAYYAGDRRVQREQLNYSNRDVAAYVRAVRERYTIRTLEAVQPPRR